MRVRFASPEIQADLRSRAVAFWAHVQQDPTPLPEAVSTRVRDLDPRVVVDTCTPGQVALCSKGDLGVTPLIDLLVATAPRQEFEIVAGRQRRPVDQALERVRVDVGLDLTRARARLGFSRGHLMEIVIYDRSTGAHDDPRALEAANYLCELLLSERTVDRWVSDVGVAPLAGGGPLRVVAGPASPSDEHFPIADLPDVFDRAVAALYEGLDEQPLIRADDDRKGWTLFELDPDPDADYEEQNDLAVTTTRCPELLKCFLEGSPFASARFSRNGETIAYVKIDDGDAGMQRRLVRRNEIERRLDDALVDAQLGSVIGTGMGLRYSYLDLVLPDVEAALPCVQRVLRAANVGTRSWLLFFDTALQDEWCPIWEDSPPPPGVEPR